MQKKHIILLVVFNVFLVFLGSIIVWWITKSKLTSLWISMESSMGSKVEDIKKSNFLALQSSLVSTIATAQKSVVNITISKDIKLYMDDPSQLNSPGSIQQQTAKVGWWSGIIVSKQGYILTNKHVVQDTTAKYSVTLYDGKIYTVDKVWFDDFLDIAILKIIDSDGKPATDLIPAPFLPLDTHVDIGQFALAIWNSLSTYTNNVTMGIIWGKNKQLTINKNNIYIWLYQTDALVNPWNSGGPLLDIQGNVLGITTAITEGEGIAFALPISQEFLKSTIKSIENFGKIVRPIVGIQYTESNGTGIAIKDVLTDLPAWEAGIKIGDIIFAINGKEITNQLPFLYQLYTYIPGDIISVDVLRNWEKLKFNVLLGGKPQ